MTAVLKTKKTLIVKVGHLFSAYKYFLYPRYINLE
jgi:hypothetical protein